MSRTFDLEIRGETVHLDPFKIRRVFLDKTDGRGWRYINDLNKLSVELIQLRVMEEAIAGGDEVVGETKEGVEAKISLNLQAISNLEGALAIAAMEAFDFEELNIETGEGVTEHEALTALKKFVEYAEGKDWRSGI